MTLFIHKPTGKIVRLCENRGPKYLTNPKCVQPWPEGGKRFIVSANGLIPFQHFPQTTKTKKT